METHVKVLGILFTVFGILGILAALMVLFLLGGLAGLVQMGCGAGSASRVAVPILGALAAFFFVLISIFSLPDLIAGYGLLHHREWARILSIIMSVLHLFGFPLGTILGIYGLWVLLNRETVALFQRS